MVVSLTPVSRHSPSGEDGRNDARAGKQAQRTLLQTRAADGHHPFAVAFIVTPADDAAEQLTVEGFQFGNQALRHLVWEAAERAGSGAADRPATWRFLAPSAVPSIGVARCQSVGVVINCGDAGSDSWLLRAPARSSSPGSPARARGDLCRMPAACCPLPGPAHRPVDDGRSQPAAMS